LRVITLLLVLSLFAGPGWAKIESLPALPDIGGLPRDFGAGIASDGVSLEKVVVPMVFPVSGKGQETEGAGATTARTSSDRR